MKLDNVKTGLRFLAACAALFGAFTSAHTAGKPNILILWVTTSGGTTRVAITAG
jgi:hypothetical protein